MKRIPKVSIIIVNWNTKRLTVNCVRSIISSKPKIPYEIIVSDNGSTDGSVEALRQLQRKTSKLHLLKNKANLGFAKGVNSGIRKAKGKYLLLLNSDTKISKGSIDELIHFAERIPGLGVVGSRLINPDKTIQPSVYRLPGLWRTIKQYWFKKKILDKYAPKGNSPVEVEAVVGAAFLITLTARKRVGILDERYFMYFEDLEYCRKVRKAGLKVYYLPSAVVIHYHGASGVRVSDQKNQWKRLVKSSKIYHGILKHYLIWFVMWTSQKAK
jgi:GT2 family glycosyltransferase